MVAAPESAHVAALRRFSRFYTRQLGLLDEQLLGSGLSLTEVRVLYEIVHQPGQTWRLPIWGACWPSTRAT